MEDPNAPLGQTLFVAQQGVNIPVVTGKPTGFSWKHFAIGSLVPIMLLITPLILLNGMEQPDWGAPNTVFELELQKGEGTNYSIDFELEDHLVISSCRIIIIDQEQTDFNYWCDNYDTHFELYEEARDTSSDKLVGQYTKESSEITFDNTIDYGESLDFKLVTYDKALEPEAPLFMLVYNLLRGICLAYPLISIAFIATGFSSGKKGLGFGGIAALLVYPVLAIISFLAIWKAL